MKKKDTKAATLRRCPAEAIACQPPNDNG